MATWRAILTFPWQHGIASLHPAISAKLAPVLCGNNVPTHCSLATAQTFPLHFLITRFTPGLPATLVVERFYYTYLTARELSNLPKVTEKMREISTGTCTVVFGGSAKSFKTQLSSHPSFWNEKLSLNSSEHSYYVYKLLFISLLHLKALTNPSHW